MVVKWPSNTILRWVTLTAGITFFTVAHGGVLLAEEGVPTVSFLTGIVQVVIAASNFSTWAYSALCVTEGRMRWTHALVAAGSGTAMTLTLYFVIVPALLN